jgi:hypothetical protein
MQNYTYKLLIVTEYSLCKLSVEMWIETKTDEPRSVGLDLLVGITVLGLSEGVSSTSEIRFV